jgi:ergothioneine biosynthesis protein EgtB
MKNALQDVITPFLSVNEATIADERQASAERYRKIRAFSETLCKPLHPEDCVIQSMPDASPAKWHLAHTSWFFETFVLRPGLANYQESAPHNSYLFNSYYNAVGPMHCRARRGMISRPTLEETYRYRQHVDAAMMNFFETIGEERWREFKPVVVLGLNHEQQHQELFLTDIKHMLAQNPLCPAYTPCPQAEPGSIAPLRWLSFAEGNYAIGHEGAAFCFDNEGPRHRTFLEEFQLASRLVTNAEYLDFMNDRGYERSEFWLSLGWMVANEQKWRAPLYWEQADGAWVNYTLSGMRKVDPAEPVCHISYFEADAFARWTGARLPTEEEWEAASASLSPVGNFVEAKHFHPVPLSAGGDGDEAVAAPHQMFGDVWEWTRSSYAPYPRYEPAKGAIGEYNGKFMCNQYVLRGGSCATSQTHIRRTYRNFFAPDKRWQFMGIRLAKDVI